MLAESVSEEGAVKGRQREGRRRGGDGSLDEATDGPEGQARAGPHCFERRGCEQNSSFPGSSVVTVLFI